MRLLHVSDWHLGATLGRIRREPDHVEVLDEIIEIADSVEPHLVMHTGDLFDSVRPPVGSMRLAFTILRRLAERAPVVVVAGNHDSRALFRLFNDIMSATGNGRSIRFVADIVKPESGGILEFPGDAGEVARLASAPFLHPNQLVDHFKTDPKGWTGKYADGVRLLQAMYARSLVDGYDPDRHINLYAAHLHVGGAVLARSERIVHVSEDYAIDSESLPPVSYAALGHIHKPQRIPGLVPGRYAGSPIQMDYGEMGEEKSVVSIEVRPGRAACVETIALTGGRPLLRFEGDWAEIEQRAAEHTEPAIVSATVVSDEPEKDPTARVADLFAQADILSVVNRLAGADSRMPAALEATDLEIGVRPSFLSYLQSRDHLGIEQAGRIGSVFERLMDAIEAEMDPVLAEEASVPGGASD